MSTPQTSIAELRQNLSSNDKPLVRAGFTDSNSFELAQRAAKALSSSSLVPQHFQNHLPNCMIALEMAQRIGASPLQVMQNLYVVHGNPSWSAKFLIATFNQCGRFSAIRYQWEGVKGKDDWGCRATATELSSGDELSGPLITIALAKSEGWYEKKGSKWKTIPELMLMYRAAAWFVNTHAPEISMGLTTAEEMGDIYDAQKDETGAYAVTIDDLKPAQAPQSIEPEPDDLQPAEPPSEPEAKPKARAKAAEKEQEIVTVETVCKAIRATKDRKDCQSVMMTLTAKLDPDDKEAAMSVYYDHLRELSPPSDTG